MSKNLALSILTFFILGVSSSLAFNIKNPVPDTSLLLKKIRPLIASPKVIQTSHPYFYSNFIYLDSVTYFNPTGTNYLFKIKRQNKQGDSMIVERLDNSVYHGHNFKNYLFYHNNTIYSFGGKGLFNSFFGLVKFDFGENQWWLVEKNIFPTSPLEIKFSYYYKDYLHIFYIEHENPQEIKYNILNLQTFEIVNKGSVYLPYINRNITDNKIYENKRYIIFKSSEKDLLLIDKKQGTIKRKYDLANFKIENGTMPYISNDNILYGTKNDNSKINTAIEDLKTEDDPIYKPHKQTENYLWGFLLAVTLVFILIFYKKRKTKKQIQPKHDSQSSEIDLVLEKIKNSGKFSLNRDELDGFLGIENKSPEYAKNVRSQFTLTVNKTYPNTIKRKRNPEDKRSFLYYFDFKII